MTLPSLLGVASIPGILGLRDALSKEEEKVLTKISLCLCHHTAVFPRNVSLCESLLSLEEHQLYWMRAHPTPV